MWVIARILSPKKSLRGTLGNLIWKWRLILEISHSIESCTPRFPFLELESSIFAGYVFVMNLSKMSIALGCLLYESYNVTSSNLVLHSMLSEYFSQVEVFLQRLTLKWWVSHRRELIHQHKFWKECPKNWTLKINEVIQTRKKHHFNRTVIRDNMHCSMVGQSLEQTEIFVSDIQVKWGTFLYFWKCILPFSII